jgi:hypothetical protein
MKIYWQTHKEETNKRRNKHRKNNREKQLLSSYKTIDKRKGFMNNLTEDWIKENITSKSCIYCDDTENLGCDRIDNTKGHIMDNCVPCCKECNYTRGNIYSFEEMKMLGYIIRKIKMLRQMK